MPNLKAKEYRQFENIKYVRQDGSEYWSARELVAVLYYSQWRNFQKVIDRAIIPVRIVVMKWNAILLRSAKSWKQVPQASL